MPIKVLGENGVGKNSSLINAIKYARDNGANICNISLGSYTYVKEIDDLIRNSNMLLKKSKPTQTMCYFHKRQFSG